MYVTLTAELLKYVTSKFYNLEMNYVAVVDADY